MPDIIPALSTYNLPTRYRWMPKFRAGQFYIGDRKYYLYAQKKCLRLEQCQLVTADLASAPYAVTDVELDGIAYSNYKVAGQSIILDLEDIDSHIGYWAKFTWDATRWDYFSAGFVLSDDTQITVKYTTLVWDSVNHQFTVTAVTQYIRLGDTTKIYKIPDTPIPDTPVVITDDSKLPTDARSYAIEYDVAPDGAITFNAETNYAPNPNFTVAPTGYPHYPYDWELVDTTGHIFRTSGTGYVGLYTLRMHDPTGKARAIITMGPDEPLTLSAWARMSGEGTTGVAYVEMAFRDSSGNILDADGNTIGADPDIVPYSVRASASLSGREWTRAHVSAGESTSFETADCVLPDDMTEVEIRLWGTGTGPIDFSAVQLEHRLSPTQYGYIGPASTVEYETDPTGIWRPDPTGIVWPFPELCHVELNAASEENHAGFVVFEEFSDWTDEDIDAGGIDETDPTGVPRGIVPRTGIFWEFGRRNLPYARMDGRTKLVNIYPLRGENQDYEHFVNTYPTPKEPKRATIVPPDNTRRLSEELHAVVRASDGILVSCIFTDIEGNSVPHELVLISNTGAGTIDKASDYTNDAGRVLCAYTGASVTGAGQDVIRFTHQLSGLVGTLHVDIV